MQTKTINNKWLYMLLSILIAIAFWLLVRTGRNPDMVNHVRGIPIVLSGERVLSNQGLMIDTVSDETVSLTWEGNWNDIRQLDKGSVSVSVDLSRITEPGVYELGYTVSYPSTVTPTALTLQSKDPAMITVTVSKIYSKTIEIEPVLKGSVVSGYQAGEFTVEPQTVQISGTREKVDQIDRVQVVLEDKKLRMSFSGELPLTLLDAEGETLDQSSLSFSTQKVYVVLPVVMTREVPVTVDFVPGGGATKDNIEYSIAPDKITVSGAEDEVRSLTEICLGSIELSQVAGVLEQKYPIYVPAGIENVSGITEAEVRVSVEGLVTKEFQVKDIQLINVPAGYTATLTTQVRTVVLRGTRSALDKVQASQIRMVADLADVANATGSYNVPVKTHLFADDDVGVVGQNNVVVNLKKS